MLSLAIILSSVMKIPTTPAINANLANSDGYVKATTAKQAIINVSL
ncbi:hypothetical protein [Bacillus cereus]|nr:hypothetical protein bthur0004_66930 [Bacillus thuringiensis serovar sotto str. T04001]HDR8078092.1 hypothetical protein [Bacillus cereus]